MSLDLETMDWSLQKSPFWNHDTIASKLLKALIEGKILCKTSPSAQNSKDEHLLFVSKQKDSKSFIRHF